MSRHRKPKNRRNFFTSFSSERFLQDSPTIIYIFLFLSVAFLVICFTVYQNFWLFILGAFSLILAEFFLLIQQGIQVARIFDLKFIESSARKSFEKKNKIEYLERIKHRSITEIKEIIKCLKDQLTNIEESDKNIPIFAYWFIIFTTIVFGYGLVGFSFFAKSNWFGLISINVTLGVFTIMVSQLLSRTCRIERRYFTNILSTYENTLIDKEENMPRWMNLFCRVSKCYKSKNAR
jgi:hypothetical protein